MQPLLFMSSSNRSLITFLSVIGMILMATMLLVTTVYLGYLHWMRLPYDLPRNLWIAPPTENKYEIVKVGNSHADDAITFSHYNLRGLKASGVAQRFRYDLVMLKQYQHQIEEGAVIIIDASHLSFSHRLADGNDGLQYNYYGAVSPLLIPNLKVSDYLQSKIVPMLRAGYLLRQAHQENVIARISAEEKRPEPTPTVTIPASPPPTTQPLPTSATPAPGFTAEELRFNVNAIRTELANPTKTPPTHFIDNLDFVFNKWYHTDEFDPKYFESNRQDLEALIAYCLEKEWRPVLITIPVAQKLEDGLLSDYKQVYLYDNIAQTNLQGTEYIDFTTRTDITTNLSLFDNVDHLNQKGAAIFSYILLGELIERGYLPKSADGYDYRPLDLTSRE